MKQTEILTHATHVNGCFTYRIYPFESFEFFCSCIRGRISPHARDISRPHANLHKPHRLNLPVLPRSSRLLTHGAVTVVVLELFPYKPTHGTHLGVAATGVAQRPNVGERGLCGRSAAAAALLLRVRRRRRAGPHGRVQACWPTGRRLLALAAAYRGAVRREASELARLERGADDVGADGRRNRLFSCAKEGDGQLKRASWVLR